MSTSLFSLTSTPGASLSSSSSIGVGVGDTVRVPLAPTAGFCIKSVTAEDGFYTYVDSSPVSSASPRPPPNLLEPTRPPTTTRTLQIPRGMKVFLNIAWDRRVPAPPEASEEVVRRAIAGADLDDEDRVGGYYVPVVVSEPREDLDKSGKPSIVFDCVFSASLKGRCMRDREFKLYLVELALEHVEEKAHTTLSRQVGTPNIASKGKLEPRTVLMPRALVEPGFASNSNGRKTDEGRRAGRVGGRASLVQELPDNTSSAKNKENSIGASIPAGTPRTNGVNPTSTPNPKQQQPLKSILKPTLAANANATFTASTAPVSSPSPSSSHTASPNTSANGGTTQTRALTSTPRPAGVGGGKPLIQEITPSVESDTGPIGERVSVNASSLDASVVAPLNQGDDEELDVKTLSALPPLRWKWSTVQDKETNGGKERGRVRIEVEIPEMTRTLHARSTLYVEPHRVILHIPQKYFLDINLALSDERIGKMGEMDASDLRESDSDIGLKNNSNEGDPDPVSTNGKTNEKPILKTIAESMQLDGDGLLRVRVRGHNAGEALRLKKYMKDGGKRVFDVENARAQWRVGEGKVAIMV